MAKSSNKLLKLLLRNEDPTQLLKFFRAIEEGFTTAFADAHARVPAKTKDRPAVYARGANRRFLMDRAFREAAENSGYPLTMGFTDPPTWSFPVLHLGAFSLTLGIVDKALVGGQRRLRGQGIYVRRHAKNNEIVNPQGNFFHDDASRMPRIIPHGSLGALVVAEVSVYQPDVPRWLGFWLPSPNLRQVYYRCSLDMLLAFLREHQAAVSRRPRLMPGQAVVRKKPMLKPIKKRKPRTE